MRLEIHNVGIIPGGRNSGRHAFSKSPIDGNQLSAWRSGRFSLKERSFLTGICNIKSNSSRPAHTLLSSPRLQTCKVQLYMRGEEVAKGTKGTRRVWDWYLFYGTGCQSKRHIGRYNIRSRHRHYNVSDICFCTDSSRWVIYPRQANIYPTLARIP